MTKREALRQTEQENTLLNLGFTLPEAETLRRISMTLHRWFEHECNGAIQRDGEDADGKPFWYNVNTGRKVCAIADRERGAMKRLDVIIAERNGRALAQAAANMPADPQAPPMDWKPNLVRSYIQGDPRGAVLYILRPGDVPDGKQADSYYSRGICVY